MFKFLFPNVFKKIGWGVLLSSLPIVIVFKYVGFSPDKTADIGSIIALIGFFLIIQSAEKDEDERIKLCRLKAMSSAFLTFIIGIFVSKLDHLFDPFNYIFNHSHQGGLFDTPMGLLYFSALFYFITFRYSKDEE
ncbi:MAG: hypothetical protein Q8M15_05505 [Bacteroidota bacterium]|nr:hypothetical protein [Bacteroidota bacterium]